MTHEDCPCHCPIGWSDRQRLILLWLAVACVALNLVAILVLCGVWRAMDRASRRSEAFEQSDSALAEIEARLLEIGDYGNAKDDYQAND